MPWNYAQVTHEGKVREHNEDDHGCFADISGAIVADGMGGHAAGEVASHLAVTTLRQQLALGDSMEEAFDAAQRVIEDASIGEQAGMGTTAVVVREISGTAQVGWCGDSRVYLWSEDKLIQVSEDHSEVGDAVRAGILTPQMARVHSQRNLINNCLGGAYRGAQMVEVGLQQNDVFLLCSDGLNDELEDEEIANILRGEPVLQKAAEALVQAALNAGGKDNITVVLMQWTWPQR